MMGAEASFNAEQLSLLDPTVTMTPGETLSAQRSTSIGGLAVGPHARRFAVGTVIQGRYRVLDLLGEGGMGVVYKVEDLLLDGRLVALKMIPEGLLKPERISLLKAEFKTMAQLSHPNVARVYDFEPLPGGAQCFTMELVEGQSLLVATKDRSVQEILDSIVQVCRALGYLHTRLFVHRDLKPSNVMVERASGSVKVLDFGLVGATAGGGILGTPAFMAPEMANGIVSDPRSDLYALGITLYQLLCRKVPFTGASMAEVCRKHAREPIAFDGPDAARIPPWLRDVIVRLCAKDPAERYPNANSVIEDINRSGGQAYELETELTRSSYVSSSQFVGRERELESVLRQVARRIDKDGGATPLFFISGTSGIGKSRLVRETKQQLQLSGITFVEGSFYEAGESELGAFADAIRHVVQLANATGQLGLLDAFGDALRRLVPDLVLPIEARETVRVSSDLSADRTATLDQVAEFLVRMSETVPYVLYINDLQWARSGAIDLLTILTRNLAERDRWNNPAALALLGSYRLDEVSGRPLAKLLDALGGAPHFDTVSLAALGRGDIARVLCSMLGVQTLPEEFVERVERETAGSPLFIEQVMRSLIDLGIVFVDRGGWGAKLAVREIEIPASMGELFERRLAQLEPLARSIVELMAVFGRPIAPAVLASAAEAGDDVVYEEVRELIRRQVLVENSGEPFEVALFHDRLRETVLESLEPGRRRDLHRRLGIAIETHYRDLTPHLEALARHFWAAGEREKVRRYALDAARNAENMHASDLAIELFEYALSCMTPEERASEDGVLACISVAQLCGVTGNAEQGRSYAKAALEAGSTPYHKALAIAAAAMLELDDNEYERGIQTMWEALELLGERPVRSRLSLLRAVVSAILGYVLSRPPKSPPLLDENERRELDLKLAIYGDLHEAYLLQGPLLGLLVVFRAGKLLWRNPSSPRASAIRNAIGMFYVVLGNYERAQTAVDEAIQRAREQNSPFDLAQALATDGIIAYLRGDLARATERLDGSRALFVKHGISMAIGLAFTFRYFTLLWRGRVREAFACADEGLQRTGRTKSSCLVPLLGAASDAWSVRGDEERSERATDRAKQTAGPADDLTTFLMHVHVGHGMYSAGNVDGAIDQLGAALDLARRKDLPPFVAPHTVAFLALALQRRRRRDGRLDAQDARRLRRLRRDVAKLPQKFPLLRPLATLVDAIEALASGDETKGTTLYLRSIEEAETIGGELFAADARSEFGRELVAAGRDERGMAMLMDALRAYERFGAEGPANDLRRVLRTIASTGTCESGSLPHDAASTA